MMSWGHDEYMYRVLKHNNTTLPEEALYMIRYENIQTQHMTVKLISLPFDRFHSFYPWHSGKDYNHLCDNKDMEMLPWIKEFK